MDEDGRGSAGEQRPGARRGDSGARTCKTRALAAPRARTPGARQNAKACQEAWVGLGINRSRLELSRSLVDKLVGPEDQVHNAN